MNDETVYDVLVVDDVESAAEDYARLINAKTGVRALSTSNVDEALKIVKYNDIKVLVLDQRMPIKTGTQLLQDMRVFTSAKAIMLTGEADKDDMGDAINLNFNAYVPKSEVVKLPDVVFDQYTKYLEDCRKELKHRKKKYLNFGVCRWCVYLMYKLEDIILDKEYVDSSRKKTYCEILSGQEKENVNEIELAEDLIIESNEEKDFLFSFKNSTKNIMASLESTVKKAMNIKHSYSRKKAMRTITKYHLTQDDEKTIDRRVIDYAPIYEVHRILLYQKTLRSKVAKQIVVIAKKFCGKYKLTQTDYMKDGTTKIKDVGYLDNK